MCNHIPRPAAPELVDNCGAMNPDRADLPSELRGVDPEVIEVRRASARAWDPVVVGRRTGRLVRGRC